MRSSPTPLLARLSDDPIVAWILVIGFAALVGGFSWTGMPEGGLDMREDILPALANWRSPWLENVPLFPWATVVLMPLRVLGPRLATSLINLVGVLLTALVLKHMRGNVMMSIPIFASPVGYWLTTTGQTDAVVLSSLLLPPGFDLLLLWKPQLVAHAFWTRLANRPRAYLAAGIALLATSLLIWGNWPGAVVDFATGHLINGWWNLSLWPYSIPLGIALVVISVRSKDECYGLMASPLLSPYVNGPSYLGLAVALASRWPRAFLLAHAVVNSYAIVSFLSPRLSFPGLPW